MTLIPYRGNRASLDPSRWSDATVCASYAFTWFASIVLFQDQGIAQLLVRYIHKGDIKWRLG